MLSSSCKMLQLRRNVFKARTERLNIKKTRGHKPILSVVQFASNVISAKSQYGAHLSTAMGTLHLRQEHNLVESVTSCNSSRYLAGQWIAWPLQVTVWGLGKLGDEVTEGGWSAVGGRATELDEGRDTVGWLVSAVGAEGVTEVRDRWRGEGTGWGPRRCRYQRLSWWETSWSPLWDLGR